MSGYWYPLSLPSLGPEEIEAATDVLTSGRTTMGLTVQQFESAFAHYVGVPHAIMVNSGSSADLLVAFALRPENVVVPAVTWPTHAWSFEMSGADLTFCDVDGFNATADLIERQATGRVDTLGIVHLMGVPCDMTDIAELAHDRDLTIIEDCCEALGARYHDSPVGQYAKAATWSFFFSHQMTTMEGGMITTFSEHLADTLRSMRSHGWARHREHADPYSFINPGFNVRPMEITAAIGLVQLEKIDALNKMRSENFGDFTTVLAGHPDVAFPAVPDDAKPSWFGIPMLISHHRDELMVYLESEGVEARPVLGGNLLRQPAFASYYAVVPGADYVHDHGLYVGLHPQVDSGADQVAHLIGEFLG